MATLITHSRVTHAHMQEFLSDLVISITATAEQFASSTHYKHIYKTSLASFAALKILGRRQLPLVKNAAESARRIAVLIACRQTTQASVEMRRFIELIVWFPYFSEHSVEWSEFTENPWTGFLKYDDNPIAFNAHREFSFYVSYIRERSKCGASSALALALADLSIAYADTSRSVHAAPLPSHGKQPLGAVDDFDDARLKEFAEMHRTTAAAGLSVVAWSRADALQQLPAVERGLFDWLLGKKSANAARAGKLSA